MNAKKEYKVANSLRRQLGGAYSVQVSRKESGLAAIGSPAWEAGASPKEYEKYTELRGRAYFEGLRWWADYRPANVMDKVRGVRITCGYCRLEAAVVQRPRTAITVRTFGP